MTCRCGSQRPVDCIASERTRLLFRHATEVRTKAAKPQSPEACPARITAEADRATTFCARCQRRTTPLSCGERGGVRCDASSTTTCWNRRKRRNATAARRPPPPRSRTLARRATAASALSTTPRRAATRTVTTDSRRCRVAAAYDGCRPVRWKVEFVELPVSGNRVA